MFTTTIYSNKKISQTNKIATRSNKKRMWIDCLKPTKEELSKIASTYKIPLRRLKRSIDEEEVPRIVDLKDWTLIILRTPYKKKGETTIRSFCICYSRDTLITLSMAKVTAIENLNKLPDEKKAKIFQIGMDNLLYNIIDEINDSFFTISDKIDAQIEKVEDQVLKKPGQALMEKFLRIKKTLIYFHRSLTGNREVLSKIEKQRVPGLSKETIVNIRETYTDTVQLLDVTSSQREILTGTLEVYLSSISNNMNKIMKKLTVYATFILVPTLISGIYGMNFRLMPELGWQYGYSFAIGIMILSVIIMYIYFKIKDWL